MAIAKKVAPWQHFVSVNGSQVDLLKPNWGAVNSKQLVFWILEVSGHFPDYTTHFRTICKFWYWVTFKLDQMRGIFCLRVAGCNACSGDEGLSRGMTLLEEAVENDIKLAGDSRRRFVLHGYILAITLCGSASPPHHCLNYVPPIVYLFGQMPPYLGLWSF